MALPSKAHLSRAEGRILLKLPPLSVPRKHFQNKQRLRRLP